jgi:group I intron endonuclease
MKISGIYSITNTINGKVYYGSSIDIKNRWSVHKSKLNKNTHENPHLQSAWNKYGKDAFKFEIVKEVPVEQLIDTEQEYLDITKQNPTLYYNVAFHSECPARGHICSDETKKKMSENNGMYWEGKHRSDETKRKMSGAHKGENNYFYGKHHSGETRQKLSIANKGQLPWNTDKNIYTFKNRITEEVFTGIRDDFRKKYNLNKAHIGDILTGERNHHKNWIKV